MCFSAFFKKLPHRKCCFDTQHFWKMPVWQNDFSVCQNIYPVLLFYRFILFITFAPLLIYFLFVLIFSHPQAHKTHPQIHKTHPQTHKTHLQTHKTHPQIQKSCISIALIDCDLANCKTITEK